VSWGTPRLHPGPPPTLGERPIERHPARPRDGEPDEKEEVEELHLPGEIVKTADLVAESREERDDHRAAEEPREEAREEAEEEAHPADEFEAGDERRLHARRRDAEAREVRDQVVEAVELAPAGADEDQAADDPREERRHEGQVAREKIDPALDAGDERRHRALRGVPLTVRREADSVTAKSAGGLGAELDEETLGAGDDV